MRLSLSIWLPCLLVPCILGTLVSANSPPSANSESVFLQEDSSVTYTFCATIGICSDDGPISDLSVIISRLPSEPGVFQHLQGTTSINITEALIPYTLPPDSKRIKYTPPPNWYKDNPFSLTYHVDDGRYPSGNAQIFFQVTGVNDAPIASNQNVVCRENTTELIALDCYDAESNLAEYEIINMPPSYAGALYQLINGNSAPGDMILSRQTVNDPNGRVWFVPRENVTDTIVTFTYSCRDTLNTLSNEGTVTINITSPPKVDPSTTTAIVTSSTSTLAPSPPPNLPPKIGCRDMIELSSDFLIGNTPAFKIPLTAFDDEQVRFKIIQTPQHGMLATQNNVSLLGGDEVSDIAIFYANNHGGGFSSVNFSFIAIDNGNLSSEICTSVLLASCPFPRVNNIFDTKKGSICVDCPDGAQCSFDGRYLPFASKGYWQSSDVFLPCSPESACPGEASQTCAPQYEGIRCGKCIAGYYRLGHECIPCSSNPMATALIIVACFVGFAILFYIFFRVVQSGTGLGLASILVNFLQTILVIRDLQLKWTLTFHSVLNVLSFINFNVDLVSPECFITTQSFRFSLKMKLVLCIPIVLVALLAIFYRRKLLHPWKHKEAEFLLQSGLLIYFYLFCTLWWLHNRSHYSTALKKRTVILIWVGGSLA
ncbi:hypothetical protein BKA69DRAFT_69499 [Paraphysoderma sedebokerense]|nr:hypothetical protein BKA69DRAFT_69499 [Paraphysoderma sedebokerense]